MCPRDFCFCTLNYSGRSFNPTAAAQDVAQQINSNSSCRESFAHTAAHNSATATATITTAGTSNASKLSAAAAAFGATAVTQRGVTESAVTAGAVRSSSFDHTTANSGSTNGVNGSCTSTNSSTGNSGYGGRRVSQNARARSESWPDQRVQGASSSGGTYSGSKLQHITEGQQQQQPQLQHTATVPRTMSCSDGLNRRASITGRYVPATAHSTLYSHCSAHAAVHSCRKAHLYAGDVIVVTHAAKSASTMAMHSN
eukprot:5764-Heterococcus_DN1.PRE.2